MSWVLHDGTVKPPDESAAPTASKAELRAWVRARRRQLADPPAQALAQGFADAVLGETAVQEALSQRPAAPALVYVGVRGEPPTGALRRRLRSGGTEVFTPWAMADRQMRWLRDDGEARAWGLPGINAPATPELAVGTDELLARNPGLLVLPALAATTGGARLGQGGGYYDTLLASCPSHVDGGPLRVALVWPWEVLDTLPAEPHDHGVDLVVSYAESPAAG